MTGDDSSTSWVPPAVTAIITGYYRLSPLKLSSKQDTTHALERYGVQIVHEPDEEAIVDIICIHGLNGSSRDSWVAENDEGPVYWLKDILPERIPMVRVLTYGYDGRVSGTGPLSHQSIPDIAEDLVTKVIYFRKQSSSELRPIIFLAHSVGGIVLKDALVNSSMANEHHKKDHLAFHESTYGILFMGTPHQGTDGAPWQTILPSIYSVFNPNVRLSRRDLENLGRDSSFLQDLSKRFTSIAWKYKTKYIYEQIPSLLPSGGQSMIVPQGSAVVPGHCDAEVFSCHTNHLGLIKFSDPDDDDLATILHLLQSMIREIHASQPQLSVSVTNPPLHAHVSNVAVYTSHMLLKRFGFPLWSPAPSIDMPLEYQLAGAGIGDVGCMVDGAFDFHFNICKPADDPVNLGRVPPGFIPFTLSPRDVLRRPNRHSPNSQYLSSEDLWCQMCNVDGDEAVHKLTTGGFHYKLAVNEGALLVLPNGADSCDLRSLKKMAQYVKDNCRIWFGDMDERGIPVTDLHLITGYENTSSWGVASFRSSRDSLAADFRFSASQRNPEEITYEWNCCHPVVANTSRENTLRNQSVFVRGFTASRRQDETEDTESDEITLSLMDGATGEGYYQDIVRLLSRGHAAGGPGVGLDGGLTTRASLPPSTYSDWITFKHQFCSAFVGVHTKMTSNRARLDSEVVHPNHAINRHILKMSSPDVDVAISHDDVWCDLRSPTLHAVINDILGGTRTNAPHISGSLGPGSSSLPSHRIVEPAAHTTGFVPDITAMDVDSQPHRLSPDVEVLQSQDIAEAQPMEIDCAEYHGDVIKNDVETFRSMSEIRKSEQFGVLWWYGWNSKSSRLVSQNNTALVRLFHPTGTQSNLSLHLPVWASVIQLAHHHYPGHPLVTARMLSFLDEHANSLDVGPTELRLALQNPHIRDLALGYLNMSTDTSEVIVSKIIRSLPPLVLPKNDRQQEPADDRQAGSLLIFSLFQSLYHHIHRTPMPQVDPGSVALILHNFFESPHEDLASWESIYHISSLWDICDAKIRQISNTDLLRQIFGLFDRRRNEDVGNGVWLGMTVDRLGHIVRRCLDSRSPSLISTICTSIVELDMLPRDWDATGKNTCSSLLLSRWTCTSSLISATKHLCEAHNKEAWFGKWLAYVHAPGRLVYLCTHAVLEWNHSEPDPLVELCYLQPEHSSWPSCFKMVALCLQSDASKIKQEDDTKDISRPPHNTSNRLEGMMAILRPLQPLLCVPARQFKEQSDFTDCQSACYASDTSPTTSTRERKNHDIGIKLESGALQPHQTSCAPSSDDPHTHSNLSHSTGTQSKIGKTDYFSQASDFEHKIASSDQAKHTAAPSAVPGTSTPSLDLESYQEVGAAGYPNDHNIPGTSRDFGSHYDTSRQQEPGHHPYQVHDNTLSSDRTSRVPQAFDSPVAPISPIPSEPVHPVDDSHPLNVLLVTFTRLSENAFRCNRCQTVIARERDAHRHATSACPSLAKEEKTRVPCNICNKDFSRRDTLRRHMRKEHGIEFPREKPGRKTSYSIT